MISYYVVYLNQKGGNIGIASCEFLRDTEIKNFKDISDVASTIKSNYSLDSVIILSWVQIEPEEVNDESTAD